RGDVYLITKEYDKAIADYSVVIKSSPNFAPAYFRRGRAWARKEECDKATADYGEAIKRNPKYAAAYSSRAWLWAACPDHSFRNGLKAIESATRACELTSWKNPYYISVLAAAYAEAGDFKQAVKWQTKALAMAPESGKAEFQYELELYQAGKSYRKRSE
ncbi:MAG: hypothetical protein V3S39_09355, partial [Thermodesulfobacteriota bacterium]